MAAPSATARVAPGGLRQLDGFSTLITFETDTNVSLWEMTVTPPGVDGGEAVDTSTMHNTTWRTKHFRDLIELTESSFVAAYDPVVLDQIILLVNVNTTVTITFPDGSTWAFFGGMRKFEPQEITEGEMPRATVTITPTCYDPDNNVEAGPTVVEKAGTP